MKIRVTIDTDQINFDGDNSMEGGVYGVDLEGVYHSWYGSASYRIEFEDVKVLECKHFYPEKIRHGLDWVVWDRLTCQDCGHKRTEDERDCTVPDCKICSDV